MLTVTRKEGNWILRIDSMQFSAESLEEIIDLIEDLQDLEPDLPENLEEEIICLPISFLKPQAF